MLYAFDWMNVAKFARPGRGLLVAVVCIASTMPGARAAAPQLKTQAPGFYRTTLGDFELPRSVTASSR